MSLTFTYLSLSKDTLKESKTLNHFNDKDFEEQIIKLLQETPMPCAIEYVAQHFKIAWGTARAILLNLVIDGRVQTQKTTKSLIFWVEKEAAP